MIPNLKEHEFDYLYEQLTSVSLYVYEYMIVCRILLLI